AFALVFTDQLAPGLALIPGSVTTSDGTIVQGNGPRNTSVLVVGEKCLPTDDVVTITYRARLLDSVENGQVIVNTATVSLLSAPSRGWRQYTGVENAQDAG